MLVKNINIFFVNIYYKNKIKYIVKHFYKLKIIMLPINS